MASPQLEKGYTKIANELIEALVRTNLSSTEVRVVVWIWRLTYGFNRKELETNLGAFATVLKSTKEYVLDVFSKLERVNVITLKWLSKEKCKLWFNKDFDKWKCFL